MNDSGEIMSFLAQVTVKLTPVKGKQSKAVRLTCHELFEKSSSLGVPNNRDPDPHICIVKSDRLVSKYVMGAFCNLFT